MNAPIVDAKTWNCTVSMLHKTTGNLIVKGIIKDKPAAFTVDTCATVSVAVSYTHLDVYKRQV